MSTAAESVVYITQIVPSFGGPPKVYCKKQYKLSSDAESVAPATQIAGPLASLLANHTDML